MIADTFSVINFNLQTIISVSYTHLDVYKRQKFLTSDILKTFMTKLKDTFALKAQLTSLQKRVGQLEKTVSELETDLKDAVYYKESVSYTHLACRRFIL